MASNLNPDEVFRLTPGKANFTKLSKLLGIGGTTIIRELFDSKVPQANLATQLQALRSRRSSSFWGKKEKIVLFPSTGTVVRSKSFDISLLCKLLREIGNLSPTIEEHVKAVKDFRNKFLHEGTITMEINDNEFNIYWEEIKAKLLRIVKSTEPVSTAADRSRYWEKAIKSLYNRVIMESDREWVRQLNQCSEVIVECTTTLPRAAGPWLLGNAQILQRYNSEPDILTALVQEILPLGMEVFGFLRGSVKIVIWTREPKALEELWRRSKTGQLREDLEKVLITEELKQLANRDAVELEVTFSEDEYMRAHEYLGTEETIGLKRIDAAAKREKFPEGTISGLGGVSERKKMPTKVGNFIRLAKLVIWFGTKALQGLFDSKIAPKDLANTLNEPYVLKILQNLRAKRMLKPHQWDLLYPPSTGVVESKSFDISLLIRLLTQEKICGIAAPATGWNDLPIGKDTSMEADLARIKYYRHKIHEHMDNGMQVIDGDFKDDWDDIKGAILRTVRHYSDLSVVAALEEDINHCLTGPLSDDDEMDLQKQTEALKASKSFPFSENTTATAINIGLGGGWLFASAYVMYRYKDDPQTLMRMLSTTILPVGVLVATIILR